MPPQLDLAGGFKGGILIINMVQAMELAQPVGIIEPAGLRHQMVCQTVRVRLYPVPVCLMFPIPFFIIFFVNLMILFQSKLLLAPVLRLSAVIFIYIRQPPWYLCLPVNQRIAGSSDLLPQVISSWSVDSALFPG